MKRRGFLAALAVLPFVPALIRASKAVAAPVQGAWTRGRTLWVGKGHIGTVQAALAKAGPGDMIFVLPGVYEIHEPLTVDKPGMSIIGAGSFPGDVTFTWKRRT